MDNVSYRNNRPVQQRSDVTPAPAQSVASNSAQNRGKHSQKMPTSKLKLAAIAALIVLVIAGAAAWYFLARPAGTAIDSNKYQAVFFTNGQVYFGKLSSVNGDYMRLKNVYYLQNKTSSDDKTSPQSASAQDASDVELIKLGNEIHGPEDEMIVSKDQILFFENLKPAGTVSKTISNFQKSKQ